MDIPEVEANIVDMVREADALLKQARLEQNVNIPTDMSESGNVDAWKQRGKRVDAARKHMAQAMEALA